MTALTAGPARSPALAGTGQMIRLALRRDRLMIPLWLLASVGTVAATVSAFVDLYPDTAGRLAFAASIQNNAALRALAGVVYDGSTIGGLTAWRVATLVTTLLGVMSIFVVTRHTRQEEETGRLELLGSTVLGRRSPLAAAMLTVTGANLLAAGLSAAVLIAAGEAVAGSLALGLALGLGGLVFGGVAALAAQLTETSRGANGLASALLGVGFVLRAVGDSAPADGATWLTWLSPLGWAGEVRAFAGNRWWVLVLMAAVALGLGLAAGIMNQRRDFGASMFSVRPGPAVATRRLSSAVTLAVRLHRGALIGWSAGFAVLGVVYGGVSSGITDLLDSSPEMTRIIQQLGGAGALIDAYFAGVLGIIGIVSTAYGVSAILRLRAEESAGRVEPVLATPTTRNSLFAAHVGFALLGPALLLVLAGLAMGLAANLVLVDGSDHVGTVLTGAMVQLPAVWVVVGVAAVLVGALPRWAGAAWGVLAVALLIGQLGAVLQLPQWVMDVSPFTHVPKLPGGTVEALPLVVLTVVAAVLVVAATAGFRRRDIG